MKHAAIWSQIETIISRHDLLQHPFYQAWTAGTLRREDLQRYATDYYHHVSAFPTYLSALHSRLPDSTLRRTILQNLCEEEIGGVAHSDLWLDFAEGMGAPRQEVRRTQPSPSMQALIAAFRNIASDRAPLAALGAFYAYESQVARIAGVKAQGLRDNYAADTRTTAYFTLHATQDVHHARVWTEQMDQLLDRVPDHVLDGVKDRVHDGVKDRVPDRVKDRVLDRVKNRVNDQPISQASVHDLLSTVEHAAQSLWNSLDGIHNATRAETAATN